MENWRKEKWRIEVTLPKPFIFPFFFDNTSFISRKSKQVNGLKGRIEKSVYIRVKCSSLHPMLLCYEGRWNDFFNFFLFMMSLHWKLNYMLRNGGTGYIPNTIMFYLGQFKMRKLFPVLFLLSYKKREKRRVIKQSKWSESLRGIKEGMRGGESGSRVHYIVRGIPQNNTGCDQYPHNHQNLQDSSWNTTHQTGLNQSQEVYEGNNMSAISKFWQVMLKNES